MGVVRALNLNLFRIIKKYGTINYNDLKKIYMMPDSQDINLEDSIYFDSDLKELEQDGRISIQNSIIKYI